MTEPGPTHPATPDELAAVYLRARDIPCPGCGYNRRDGTTAACPECGHTLKLESDPHAIDPDFADEFAGVAIFVSATLTILASIVLYQEARRAWVWSDIWLIAAATLAITACGVIACSNAIRAAQDHKDPARKLRIAFRLLAIAFGLFISLLLLAGIAS